MQEHFCWKYFNAKLWGAGNARVCASTSAVSPRSNGAPTGNKPTPEELRNCRPYFERELELLKNLKVLVALGKVAFDTYLEVLKARGAIRSRAAFVFGHDCQFTTAPGQPLLVSSYHPS